MRPCEIAIMGAGIIDIPVLPADPSVFTRTSTPVEHIGMTTGGDALNESTVLSHLGRNVRLVSRWGCDMAGEYLTDHCARLGIDTSFVTRAPGLATGINIVLVGTDGERRFYTNPHGSLRKLYAEDFSPACLDGVRIFTIASVFVSPEISIDEYAAIARTAQERGVITCSDFVLPKKGETVDDLAPLMAHLDYVFANENEASVITGQTAPQDMAQSFLSAGAKHAVIKLGARGCLIASADGMEIIPAYSAAVCVDTTGAGDTFAAGFQHALLNGRSFADCARYANACASLAVEAVGASAGISSPEQADARYGEYCAAFSTD